MRLDSQGGLKDLKFDDTIEYTLVSPAEANFEENKISSASPIGKALLGKSVGEKVEVQEAIPVPPAVWTSYPAALTPKVGRE